MMVKGLLVFLRKC